MVKATFICFLVFTWINGIRMQTSSAEPVLLTTTEFTDTTYEASTAASELSKSSSDDVEDEKTIMERFLRNSEVIQFNVGGEVMYTSRASLLHVADSTLSKTLLNNTDENISIDQDGNVFLDLNPALFRHLLDQLRLFEEGDDATFHPPSTPALTESFNALLKKLRLHSAPASDDDIFTFNVGDEIIATRRKTLSAVPNSRLSSLLTMNQPSDMDPSGRPFLDYDPSLFRHLLAQLQAGQTANFEAPSTETRAAFNAMLSNFGLNSA